MINKLLTISINVVIGISLYYLIGFEATLIGLIILILTEIQYENNKNKKDNI